MFAPQASLFWELSPDTRSLHPFNLVFSIPTEEFDLCPEGNRLVSKRSTRPPFSEPPGVPLKRQVLRLHTYRITVSDDGAPQTASLSSQGIFMHTGT